MEPVYEPVQGALGEAAPLAVPDDPTAAETVCLWLMTAPAYHPFWSQYLLIVVRLTDGLPGFPDPHHQFEGTTHELMVVALNPDHRQTVETANACLAGGSMPHYLVPQNVVEQYIATDDEMRKLASLCAQGVVHGVLNPDTDGRSNWLPATTKTLAHIRGEIHAP
jgi:hypothetical protein